MNGMQALYPRFCKRLRLDYINIFFHPQRLMSADCEEVKDTHNLTVSKEMIGRRNRQGSCSDYSNNDPNIEVSVSHRLRGGSNGSSVLDIAIVALALVYQSARSALLIFLEEAFKSFFTLLVMLSLIVLAKIALSDF